MSDQYRWFKLWFTATSDSRLCNLDRGLRWAWAAVGCYTKAHGTHGVLVLTDSPGGLGPLASSMGTPADQVYNELMMLPHLEVKKRHGQITVTWHNWIKFQEDSTQAERARASRSKRRGEKTRGEIDKIPPIAPPITSTRRSNSNGSYPADFEAFWSAYPRKVGKGAALKVWKSLHPIEQVRQAIFTALSWQVESPQWTRDNGDFIPHPGTWLRQRRWEDESPANSADEALRRDKKIFGLE